MKNSTFTLEVSGRDATPPFTYDYVPLRRAAFWIVREDRGRRVGRAATRAGARAAVRSLYELIAGRDEVPDAQTLPVLTSSKEPTDVRRH